jgi:hypothetical protein
MNQTGQLPAARISSVVSRSAGMVTGQSPRAVEASASYRTDEYVRSGRFEIDNSTAICRE